MPRIPPVAKQELPATYDILEKQADKLPDDVDSTFWNRQPTVRVFSNNPAMGEAHVTANTYMWTETGLSQAESECIILTVARELECALLWHDHVMLAIDDERLPEAAVRHIAADDPQQLDDSLERLATYVTEYVDTHGAVTDDTHEMLASVYDEATLIGIVKLTGFYVALSHEVNALQLDRTPFVGWDIENIEEAEGP